jgi:hypothetical protein
MRIFFGLWCVYSLPGAGRGPGLEDIPPGSEVGGLNMWIAAVSDFPFFCNNSRPFYFKISQIKLQAIPDQIISARFYLSDFNHDSYNQSREGYWGLQSWVDRYSWGLSEVFSFTLIQKVLLPSRLSNKILQ